MTEMNPACQVVVLGAAAVDWVAMVKNLPPPDGICFAEQVTTYPGGSGGNTAEGLARLGYAVRFLGVLGDDVGGQSLLRAFQEAGVDTTGIRIARGERSAACFIAVDSRGQRMIFALGGVALYEQRAAISADWLAGAKILYIADAYPEVALAAINNLELGARVVFSPGGLMASAGMDVLRPVLEQADILILNRGEVESLTKETDLEQACARLGVLGPKVILLTLGDQGVMVADEGTISHVPAEVVDEAVDTTGAGDAFSTGLMAGMLEGLGWEQSAGLGCKVAALKIRHFGARSGLPGRASIQPWLAAGAGKVNEVRN